MITVLRQINGRPTSHEAVDSEWVRPDAAGVLWVDLSQPTAEEARVLADVFHFHELSVEDALATVHHPKVETYADYLYLILHGIDFRAAGHHFATHDTDFFIGPNYLVTVHDAKTRSTQLVRDLCLKSEHVLKDGPLALCHRIIDSMVDHYRPEVDKLRDQIDALERDVFEGSDPDLMRALLGLKRDVASLRRVVLPQRDVVGRLARREFAMVTEAIAYRFRDVHDQLVRLTDEAMYFQDRITGLLEAHLATVSNRLNGVMKVLTLITTVFMPLTVLTSLYGMNVELPHLPGGPNSQFWWIVGMMVATSASMFWFFRTRRWL